MMPSNWKVFLALCLAIGGALGGGCASTGTEDGDPSVLMKEAEEEISSDHFQLAIDKLRAVKNKYPYSKFAVDAQLRIADVYFMQESFAEAGMAYEAFRDLHPKHEKTPYAMFRIGESYFNDLPGTVARDLTPAYRALDAFNDFLKKYPASPDADKARKSVVDLRRMLAEKEFYIAEFYFKRDEPFSAKGRYEKIIALYPETDFAKTSKERLAKVGEQLKDKPAPKQESKP